MSKILVDVVIIQQALETLENVFGQGKVDVSAINALRSTLTQPHVKPLSPKEIDEITKYVMHDHSFEWEGVQPWVIRLIRAIESSHNIKETL
jgi:hypothetical protein